MTDTSLPLISPGVPPAKLVVPPAPGEVITSSGTGRTYTMGNQIGEGYFGLAFECVDFWGNELAAKVLKPIDTYDRVRTAAESELQKLLVLRHPKITYIFDAFEYRDTFYIITERCSCPLTQLFSLENFNGLIWLIPIARCVLQAIEYIHLNQYAHQDIHLGNVFAAFAKDEMCPTQPGAIQFKVGDLGVAKLFSELDVANTLAEWIRPPEAIDSAEFGPIDHRIDIYHVGLLFLQLAYSQVLQFTREQILEGRPRDMALELPAQYRFAIEKALRRHVAYRTATAPELWHDLLIGNEPATQP